MIAGFKPDEMAVITAGRKTGKSVWSQMVKDLTMPDVTICQSAVVDGEIWYTVQLSIPAREWLREQPKEHWCELKPGREGYFDISEKIYVALKLKF